MFEYKLLKPIPRFVRLACMVSVVASMRQSAGYSFSFSYSYRSLQPQRTRERYSFYRLIPTRSLLNYERNSRAASSHAPRLHMVEMWRSLATCVVRLRRLTNNLPAKIGHGRPVAVKFKYRGPSRQYRAGEASCLSELQA